MLVRTEKLLAKLIETQSYLSFLFLCMPLVALRNEVYRCCLKCDVLMTRASLQTVVVVSLLVF